MAKQQQKDKQETETESAEVRSHDPFAPANDSVAVEEELEEVL